MQKIRGHEKLDKNQLIALIGIIKALIYVRVSTDQQVDNYSIESQIDLCIKEAIKKGISESEILVCVEEGESGDDPNRPMLNYILFLLEKGIGKSVIILHPNRLSRYLHLQQSVTHKIWECGCELHFVEFELIKDNPESELMYNVQGSIAQYNKAKILADTRRGRVTKLISGKIPGGQKMFGYTFDKEQDIYVQNDLEREGYELMVDMIINGENSCSGVAKYMSKKYKSPKGGPWFQTTVSRILRNPAYMGVYFYGKTKSIKRNGKKTIIDVPEDEWFRIPIPAYISKERYDLLQEKLNSLIKSAKHVGRPSKKYILKGLVRCGRCGFAASAGAVSKTQEDTYKYYVCTRKSKKHFEAGTGKHNDICAGPNWRADLVDMTVWNRIVNIIKQPHNTLKQLAEENSDIEKIEATRTKIKQIEKSVADKNNSKNRYLDLYADGIITTKQSLLEKTVPLDESIVELEKEFHYLQGIIASSELIKNQIDSLKETFVLYNEAVDKDNIDHDVKRSIILSIVEKVVLNEDEIEIMYKFNGDGTKHENKYNGERIDSFQNLNVPQVDGRL